MKMLAEEIADGKTQDARLEKGDGGDNETVRPSDKEEGLRAVVAGFCEPGGAGY